MKSSRIRLPFPVVLISPSQVSLPLTVPRVLSVFRVNEPLLILIVPSVPRLILTSLLISADKFNVLPEIKSEEPLNLWFTPSIAAVEPLSNSNAPDWISKLLNMVELFKDVVPFVCMYLPVKPLTSLLLINSTIPLEEFVIVPLPAIELSPEPKETLFVSFEPSINT